MRRKKPVMNKAFILLAFFVGIFVAACQNPLRPHEGSAEPPPGMGSFSLSIAREGVQARTIMPDVNRVPVTWYRLVFTSVNNNGEVLEFRLAHNALNPVNLPEGSYTLKVYAYADEADIGDPENGQSGRPMAWGVYENTVNNNRINVTPGARLSGVITLLPFGVVADATGTFSWNIELEGLYRVLMEIIPFSLNPQEPYLHAWFLVGGDNSSPSKSPADQVELPAGFYRVVLTLEKAPGANMRPVIWREILHIHKNLTSHFAETFTANDFLSAVFDVEFNLNYPGADESGLCGTFFHDHFSGLTAEERNQFIPPLTQRPGFLFIGWYTNQDCASNICACVDTCVNRWDFLPLTGKTLLYARWEQLFTVTMQTVGSGTANAAPHPLTGNWHQRESTVTVTATPADGYRFDRWEVIEGGVTISATGTPATFIMPAANVTITAVFVALPPDTPALTLEPPLLTFASGPRRPAAETVTIRNTGTGAATVTGIALDGYDAGSFALYGTTITNIPAGGTATFTVRPIEGLPVGLYEANIIVTYDEGRTARANIAFEVVAFTVNMETQGLTLGNGTVNANPSSAPQGDEVTITATATGRYRFVRWEVVTGAVTLSTTTASPATFDMPAANVTIRAVFEAPRLTLEPQSVTFAAAPSRPAAETVTIRNTGTGAATVTAIALDGVDTASFVLSGATISNLPVTIPAGGTADFTVQPSEGLAIRTHNAEIIVAYEGGTATANVAFTLLPPVPTGLTIDPHNNTMIRGHATYGTQTFTATVLPPGALQNVEWSVYPAPEGVSITEAGVLTVGGTAVAHNATLTVTARVTVDGVIVPGILPATVAVTVHVPPETITVTAPAATIVRGGAAQTFTAEATAPAGAHQGVTWSTVPGSITGVSINPGTGALTVLPNAALDQTVTVRATTTFPGSAVYGQATISVIAPVPTVSVTPGTATIVRGGSAQTFTANVTGPAGIDPRVTWTIYPANAATITSSSDQQATVQVTVDNTHVSGFTVTAASVSHSAVSDYAVVTVNLPPGAGVSAPTLASRTTNSIVINAVAVPGNGQVVEYAISTTNTPPANGWQAGLSFTELQSGTTFYIFARSAANPDFNAGPASAPLVVVTLTDIAPPGTFITFDPALPPTEALRLAIEGETITINVNPDAPVNDRQRTFAIELPADTTASFTWHVNSSEVIGSTTNTFTLTGGASGTAGAHLTQFDVGGINTLFVTMMFNGLPYGLNIPITVVNQ